MSRRTTEIAEDVLLDSGSHGDSISSTRLDLSQGDLSSYKKRIDANVEQQREHSDMMAGLQRKVIFSIMPKVTFTMSSIDTMDSYEREREGGRGREQKHKQRRGNLESL